MSISTILVRRDYERAVDSRAAITETDLMRFTNELENRQRLETSK